MNKMEQKSSLLKVTGILMIIFAGLGIILGAIALAGAVFITAHIAGIDDGIDTLAGLIIISLVILLIAFLIQLIAGIFGVKNSNKPEKANTCIVFGIIVILMTVLSTILNISGGTQFDVTQVLMLLIGLVIPVLYLIGAFNLKKMAG